MALLAVSAIYGFFYVAVKLLLLEITQAQLILLRFVLTGLIVGVLEWGFFRTKITNRQELFKIIGLGILGVFLVQILIVMGVHRTTAFHSALIMATMPIITLTFSMFLGREAFSIQKISGILLSFVGVAILLASKNPGASLPESYLLGDVLMLLAAFLFSIFLLGSQTLLKQYNSYSLMAYCYIISGLLFSMVYFGGAWVEPETVTLNFLKQLSMQGWALILYVVLFASIATYTLNNYALRRSTPSLVAIYIFIQPIISAALGFYILGAPFNLSMATAAIITFIGVLLASLASHQESKAKNMEEPH